jgi:hypothetical protein
MSSYQAHLKKTTTKKLDFSLYYRFFINNECLTKILEGCEVFIFYSNFIESLINKIDSFFQF